MEIIRLVSGYSQTIGYIKLMSGRIGEYILHILKPPKKKAGQPFSRLPRILDYFAEPRRKRIPRRRPATAHMIIIAGSIKSAAFSDM